MSYSQVNINVWKALQDIKYPKFIVNILKSSAFDRNSLLYLNEKSVQDIEKYITENPELLRGSPYFAEFNATSNTGPNLDFKFKIGHKQLLLNIPKFLKKKLQSEEKCKRRQEKKQRKKH